MSTASENDDRDIDPLIFDVTDLLRRHVESEGTFEVCLPRLQLRAGNFCAFVGTSGSGKSTLLDMLGLVLEPSWQTRFRFTPNASSSYHKTESIDLGASWRASEDGALAAVRRQHMGYVLQAGGLFPYLNVGQNIDLPRRLCGLSVDRATTETQLRGFGLRFGHDKRVTELSGGERQRVAILRALAHKPTLILADEPTAAVDGERARVIVQRLREYASKESAGVVMVTHDLSLLEPGHDRVFELRHVEVSGNSAAHNNVRYVATETHAHV